MKKSDTPYDSNLIEQHTTGDFNRVAGCDYYEENYSYHYDKDCRLSLTMNEQDNLAENNELFFKKRFGFDAPLEQRKQLLSVKNVFDFTDEEIRLLKQSSFISLIKGKPLSLSPNISNLCVGFFFLLESVYVVCLALILFLSINQLTLDKLLIMGCMMLLSITALYIAKRIALEPWEILRRRGIKLGQKWQLD